MATFFSDLVLPKWLTNVAIRQTILDQGCQNLGGGSNMVGEKQRNPNKEMISDPGFQGLQCNS